MITWLKKLFGSSKQKNTPQRKILLWGVIEGPYLREDLPEEELFYADLPIEAEAMLVCKVEEDGEVFVVNLWYRSMNDAYEIKKYFDHNIEPLEITYV